LKHVGVVADQVLTRFVDSSHDIHLVTDDLRHGDGDVGIRNILRQPLHEVVPNSFNRSVLSLNIANEWKRNQEAMKKDGIILSYKVLTTEAHSNTDWNIMLMTEYKDLATMEANEEKADALAQRVIGDDAKQIQGYKDRLEYREVMADRLAREMVLEPRR